MRPNNSAQDIVCECRDECPERRWALVLHFQRRTIRDDGQVDQDQEKSRSDDRDDRRFCGEIELVRFVPTHLHSRERKETTRTGAKSLDRQPGLAHPVAG